MTEKYITQKTNNPAKRKEVRDKISEHHKGKHYSVNTEFKKGIEPWDKGLKLSEEQKSRLKVPHPGAIGNSNGKDFWFSENKVGRTFQSIHPNKPEQQMIDLIKENNLPFNFVGDGQVILGGFNPDFLSKNPKHIIEVYGDYWHNLPHSAEQSNRRLDAYFKLGYKTLIIWEHELKNTSQVLAKINNFMENK